jgi:hypothetical protein
MLHPHVKTSIEDFRIGSLCVALSALTLLFYDHLGPRKRPFARPRLSCIAPSALNTCSTLGYAIPTVLATAPRPTTTAAELGVPSHADLSDAIDHEESIPWTQ